MASVVGQASAAATSVAIPAHQAGDMILVFARGTAAAPSVPAAGGTVPAWQTLQSGLANSIGLTVVSFVATATTTTTGVFTNATHICVLVLRPAATKKLQTSAALSTVGNGNNTQTIIYPALTLGISDGTSTGVRVGTRITAITAVGTAPSGWTNQTIQPAGASALMSVHTRAALTTNPTADTVTVTSSNAAYRAVTVEVQEVNLVTNVSVTGLGTAQQFGVTTIKPRYTVAAPSVPSPAAFGARTIPQFIAVVGVSPSGLDYHIVGEYLVGQAVVGFSGTQFGVPDVHIVTGIAVTVGGVSSAQSFGAVTTTSVYRLGPVAIPSAQAFGAPQIKTTVTRQVTALGTAQAFGAITFRTLVARTVNGLGSAQAFGNVSFSGTNFVAVNGLGSAQAFGTLAFRLGVPAVGVGSAQAFGVPTTRIGTAASVAVSGLVSAQSFGSLTIRTTTRVSVAGIPSAQSFGTARAGQLVQVPGLHHGEIFFHILGQHLVGEELVGWHGDYLFGRPAFGMQYKIGGVDSAQQFGTLYVYRQQFVTPPGVPSAQQFGSPYIYWQQFLTPAGVPSAQRFGVPWIAFAQKQPVPGLGSAQQFGAPYVYRVYLKPPPTYEVILDPAVCAPGGLVAAACADVTLVAAAWGEQTLQASETEETELAPSVAE